MWLISTACHELLDAIPVLVADQEKDGDIVKTDSIADDIADTARYGIKSMLNPNVQPKLDALADSIQSVREQHAAKVIPEKPGEDWFKGFGGKAATHREKKK
jgi:hypothetical protein